MWLVPSVDLSCRSPSLTENVVLVLNWTTGIRRVFSKTAFSHLFECGFTETKLVVTEVRPAVNLIASFISDFVMPLVLLVTTLPIVVNHRSVSGSLNDKILALLNINEILCCSTGTQSSKSRRALKSHLFL